MAFEAVAPDYMFDLWGIFVDAGGTDTLVVKARSTAPGTGGQIHSDAGPFRIGHDSSGSVVLHSYLEGGSHVEGIFVDAGGTGRAAALDGDPAPGTGGGVYLYFGGMSVNASGEVAFRAAVSGGSIGEGLFVDSGGTDTVLVLLGDPAPGTGGGTCSSLGAGKINASGDVLFAAGVTGGTTTQGLFVASGSTDANVALVGEAAPGTGGGSYSDFPAATINNSGTVAFKANVTGGTTSQGIFTTEAPTPQVPTIGTPGLLATGLWLLISGALIARAYRRG